MKVEVYYRAVATIEGDTMEEICRKWECLPLDDKKNGIEFVDMMNVMDAYSCADLTQEFKDTY